MFKVLLLLWVFLFDFGQLCGQTSENDLRHDAIKLVNNEIYHIKGNGLNLDIIKSSTYIEVLKKTKESGVIVLKFCANKSGIVTFAELNIEETNITDRNLLKLCIKAANQFEVKPKSGAPKEQCGKVMFLLNIPSIDYESNRVHKDTFGQSKQKNLDTINVIAEFDLSENGLVGRKINDKDYSATFYSLNEIGFVEVKICVNQSGFTVYAELLNKTTIKDKNTLKRFLSSAYKWRFLPDMNAPKEQCGKFLFNIDNTVNRKLKG